jgi:hypothetical protein
MLYHVHGLTVAKDEIYGALNVAVLEVVTPRVIAKGVLTSVESTVVEGRLVASDSKRCSLSSRCSRWWYLCGVLYRNLPMHEHEVKLFLIGGIFRIAGSWNQ